VRAYASAKTETFLHKPCTNALHEGVKIEQNQLHAVLCVARETATGVTPGGGYGDPPPESHVFTLTQPPDHAEQILETSGPRPAPKPITKRHTPGGKSALLECLECKKWFWTRDKHVGRRRYCSWECRRAGYPKDHGSPLTPEERHQAKIEYDREYRKKNRKKINRAMRRKRRRRTPEQKEQERRRRRRYYEQWKAKQPPEDEPLQSEPLRNEGSETGPRGNTRNMSRE